jgi:hypothetical protein
MADNSPLKRTVAIDFSPLPDTSGILAGGLARVGTGLSRLAAEVDYEQRHQDAEQKALDKAAERARVQAQLVSARLSGSTQLNDLYSSFDKDEDPATAAQRFDEGASKIHDKLAQGLTDQEAINSFSLNFGEMAESRRVNLKAESLRRETASAVATLDTSLDTFAQQAADAKSEAERNAALDAAEAGVKGLVDTGMLSAQEGAKRVGAFKKNLSTLDARRFVFADPVRAKKALEDGAFANLEPLDRQTLIEHAQAEIEQRERALTAARIEARQTARDNLGQIRDVIEAGYPVAPELFANAKRALGAAADPSLNSQYNSLVRTSGMVARLRGATPQEAQAIIMDLDRRAAGGATGELAEAATAARKFYGTMTETLGKDPLAWASRQGVVNVAPMRLDGSDAPDAWRARVRTAELVAERYGTAPQYLTDSETDLLKVRLATGSADDKLAVLGGLTAALGSRAGTVLQSIAKDQPVAAHVAGMLMPGATSDQIGAARDALRGEALLNGPAKEGASDLRPSAQARTSPAAIAARNALSFAPEDSARVIATAEAIYAARASRLGLRGADAAPNATTNSRKADDLWEQSLNAALGATTGRDGKQYGGIAEYRGVPVVVPSSMAADDFETTVRALKDADLVAGSGSGQAPVIAGRPFTSTDLKRSYLMPIGDGQYAISVTDPNRGAPSIVEDSKGQPYKLDLSRVPRFDFVNIGRETVQ